VRRFFLLVLAVSLPLPEAAPAQELYDAPSGVGTRWFSFQIPTGAVGQGGRSQQGRKGAAGKTVKPGQTITLAEIEGAGGYQSLRSPHWPSLDSYDERIRDLGLPPSR
jgi:hypothetical protein